MEQTTELHKAIGPPLTPRECDVLRLLVSRATDKEIAAALGISPRTASHHVASILRKLDVETRAGARRWAAGNGVPAMAMLASAPPSPGAESGPHPA